jgi:hypothetical protein
MLETINFNNGIHKTFLMIKNSFVGIFNYIAIEYLFLLYKFFVFSSFIGS